MSRRKSTAESARAKMASQRQSLLLSELTVRGVSASTIAVSLGWDVAQVRRTLAELIAAGTVVEILAPSGIVYALAGMADKVRRRARGVRRSTGSGVIAGPITIGRGCRWGAGW